MLETKTQKVREKAIEILKAEPKGIRWMELLKAVKTAIPDLPTNIGGYLWNLDAVEPTRHVLCEQEHETD